MDQVHLNFPCNFWSLKTGIYFGYGKSNSDIEKLLGHKKQ